MTPTPPTPEGSAGPHHLAQEAASAAAKAGPAVGIMAVVVLMVWTQTQTFATKLDDIATSLHDVELAVAKSDAWTRDNQSEHERELDERLQEFDKSLRALDRTTYDLRARLTALEPPRR